MTRRSGQKRPGGQRNIRRLQDGPGARCSILLYAGDVDEPIDEAAGARLRDTFGLTLPAAPTPSYVGRRMCRLPQEGGAMEVLRVLVKGVLSTIYWLLRVGRVWMLVGLLAPTFILVGVGVAGWLGVPEDARASAVPLTAIAVFVALLALYVRKRRRAIRAGARQRQEG
jgi:hypothetical protein